VKTLYLAGAQDSINLARDMGIESLSNKGDYGLTLVLGGGEVTPLEITSAYSVFANNGIKNKYTPIIEITDKQGNILEKIESNSIQILDKEVALKISNILSDNVARTPAYGQSSVLSFPTRDVAVKTGTTNDYKDAWIIGYTPSIAVGAWAGNNDNTPMEKKVAGFIVAPMWRAFMDKALARLPIESFEEPLPEDPTIKPVLRGMWMGGKSEGERVTGGIHSILYWVDKTNPRGDYPTNPGNDSQFINWEYGIQKWKELNGLTQDQEIILN
jgi:membrane peptidoglycan carboxypeptidase